MGMGGVFLRKIRAGFSDRPTGFLWVEDRRLAASGYPASRRQLEWVSKQGVNSVLTLTEDQLPAAFVEGLGLSLEHVPMMDHQPPSMESLEKAASYVQGQAEAGRVVMVHCLAGRGRTMCAIAAYLIRNKGMTASEAIKELRAARPGAVETGQEKAVYDYEARLRGQAGSR
jgi:protein-tyrosine phosphatase